MTSDLRKVHARCEMFSPAMAPLHHVQGPEQHKGAMKSSFMRILLEQAHQKRAIRLFSKDLFVNSSTEGAGGSAATNSNVEILSSAAVPRAVLGGFLNLARPPGLSKLCWRPLQLPEQPRIGRCCEFCDVSFRVQHRISLQNYRPGILAEKVLFF